MEENPIDARIGSSSLHRAGSSTWSSKNGTKVCGWMVYTVADLRTSLGHGDAWIGVPVRCYMECNNLLIPPCCAHIPALSSVVIKSSHQCIVESVGILTKYDPLAH